jgi:GT2 family glycosyltransferase
MVHFSVIIPTCKRREALARCLRELSPANQGIEGNSYEVLVADDEGSEETLNLAKSILPNAIYLRGPQRGPAANRNAAAARASGKWLVFTDDDCVPKRGWLQSFVSSIRSDCRVYEGKTTCEQGLMSALDTAPVNEEGGKLWSCNFMIEAALFKRLGGFDESFPFPAMEDIDLRERILDRGLKFDYVPGATVDHPPRKVKKLSEFINHHRSNIYFQKVKRGLTPSLSELLLVTLKFRLRALMRPGIRDAPKAAAYLIAECFWICLKFKSWQNNPSSHLAQTQSFHSIQ